MVLDPDTGSEVPMTLFGDDDKPRKVAVHEIGQDLSQLSIEEIGRRMDVLSVEIERLSLARAAKQASKNAADAFFRPPG